MIDRSSELAVSGTGAKRKRARSTDGTRYLTPQQIADRWAWHVESVRRAIRQRRLESVVIFGRRLVPVTEIERVETEGRITRVA